jgi:hypothetical protein
MTGTTAGGGPFGGETVTPTRVFISYRHDDTAGYAGWIKGALEQRLGNAAEIFIDIDNIPVGTDFVQHIQHEVGRCDVMLALIGPSWLTTQKADGTRRLDDPNDFIRLELEAAIAHGRKVLPILLHGAKMPEPGEVPSSLQPVTYKEALEVSEKRFDYDIGQLVQYISHDRHDSNRTAAVHQVEEEQPTPQQSRSRRWMFVGVGTVAVLALGLGVFLLTRPRSSFPNSSEKTLLTRAGATSRDCKRAATTGQPPAGQIAAVTCSGVVGGPDTVTYALFNSGSDLQRAFELNVRSAKVTENNGNDCLDLRTAAHPYSSSTTSGGNVLCYVKGSNSFMAWTDEDARVLGVAERTDTHDVALYTWWSAKVSRSGVPPQADLNLLKAHVPTSRQADCTYYNLDFGTNIAIDCSNNDYDIQYFQFPTTAAMDAEFTKLQTNANPPPNTGAAFACPSRGNVTVVATSVQTGQFFCELDSGTQHPDMWWTNTNFNILGWVGAHDTDAAALNSYWANLGPVTATSG